MPTNHGSIEWLKFPDPNHPGDDTRLIKKWLRDSWARRKILALQQAIAAIVVPTASTANPQMDGTAAPGVSTDYARADHVHPHDSSKADTATTYTKSQIDAMIPSVPSASTANPAMDGTASAGSSTAWARGDHVHPHDDSKADVAKFAIVEGTALASGGFSATVAYPDGFSFTNCVMLSLNVEFNSTTWRIAGDGVCDSTSRVFGIMNQSGIGIYNGASQLYSKKWRIALMRTDI